MYNSVNKKIEQHQLESCVVIMNSMHKINLNEKSINNLSHSKIYTLKKKLENVY